MAQGQKAVLDVRLLGLDEKANPRASVLGVIVDGRNFTMNKDARVEKRPGSAALAMLDTAGVAVTGARELCHLDDELLLHNGKKIYSREPTTGAWIAKGRTALERMDIRSLVATNATCDGTDSALHMDSAVIGNYVLTIMDNTNVAGSTDDSHGVLSDLTTGENLGTFNVPPACFGHTVGTDGHATTPTFVVFAANAGTLQAGVWDAATRSMSYVTLFSDLSTLPDPNTYGLQPYGCTGAPYAVVRVAANTWLVAYQQVTTGKLVVRRFTRSTGTTFSVGSVVEVGFASTQGAIAIAWSFTEGATDAHVVAACDLPAPLTIISADVAIADATVSNVGSASPDAWNGGSGVQNPRCRGVTGSGGSWFFDVQPKSGGRHVYIWAAGDSDATLAFADCGLLTHAFLPSTRDVNEIGVGIAYLSDWQPSAFLMRVIATGSAIAARAIGAHINAGDFAGRPMCRRLPNLDFGTFPVAYLNNPTALGKPGTALVKLATLSSSTAVSVSQPAQVAGTLVMPGACLKAYDGKHVTEAAFPLGPETVTPTESLSGLVYYAAAGKVLTTTEPPVVGSSLLQAFAAGAAEIALETAVGVPAVAGWPAGTVLLDFWARIVNPTAMQDYTISSQSAPSAILRTSGSSLAYQSSFPAAIPVTSAWTHVQMTVTAPAVAGATSADRLIWRIVALSTNGADVGPTLEVAITADKPAKIATPFPVIENGTRQYCAVAAWSDTKGRTQRSQPCPAVSLTTAAGLAASVVVPMVNVTERDPVTNLDAEIAPAEIEIYRTAVNATTFYRVGKVTNSVNGADVTFTDDTPDAELVANEMLYTTGGAVESWPPPGCNLVASHQGRVFVCTSGNAVLFTAYAQEGEGLAFAAEYQVETGHIPGRITALLSLDDKLAIGSTTGVASLAGIGPEVSGLPAYDSPMFIGHEFGPTSQRACARTPGGWEMVTPHGMYMLDRGLSLNWTGPQVNVDAPGSGTWYAATYTPTGDQVRFSTAGLVLVHDLTLPPAPNRVAQWFRWTYPSNVVAFASVGGVLYQLEANGTVYQADSGTSDAGTAYQEWLQLAVVNPGGVNGWARISAIRLACNIVASTTLKVVLGPEEGNFSLGSDTHLSVGSGALQHVVCKPRYGKLASTTMWIGENAATTTAGITLDAIGLLVATKGGLGRMPTANRMARSA